MRTCQNLSNSCSSSLLLSVSSAARITFLLFLLQRKLIDARWVAHSRRGVSWCRWPDGVIDGASVCISSNECANDHSTLHTEPRKTAHEPDVRVLPIEPKDGHKSLERYKPRCCLSTAFPFAGTKSPWQGKMQSKSHSLNSRFIFAS